MTWVNYLLVASPPQSQSHHQNSPKHLYGSTRLSEWILSIINYHESLISWNLHWFWEGIHLWNKLQSSYHRLNALVGFLRVRKRLFIPERTCLHQLMAVLYVTLLRRTPLWWSSLTFLDVWHFRAPYSASFFHLQHVVPGTNQLFPPVFPTILPQECCVLPLPCSKDTCMEYIWHKSMIDVAKKFQSDGAFGDVPSMKLI